MVSFHDSRCQRNMHHIVLRQQTWDGNSEIPDFTKLISQSLDCPLHISARALSYTLFLLDQYTDLQNASFYVHFDELLMGPHTPCSIIDIYDTGCLLPKHPNLAYPGDCSIACVLGPSTRHGYWGTPEVLHNCLMYPLISRLLSYGNLSTEDSALVRRYGYRPLDFHLDNGYSDVRSIGLNPQDPVVKQIIDGASICLVDNDSTTNGNQFTFLNHTWNSKHYQVSRVQSI